MDQIHLHVDSACGDDARKGDLKGDTTYGTDARLDGAVFEDGSLFLLLNIFVLSVV